jgi:hypothetical protein
VATEQDAKLKQSRSQKPLLQIDVVCHEA